MSGIAVPEAIPDDAGSEDCELVVSTPIAPGCMPETRMRPDKSIENIGISNKKAPSGVLIYLR